jgi:tripartite-type tricarboxylate transporter receptor subunit TctC
LGNKSMKAFAVVLAIVASLAFESSVAAGYPSGPIRIITPSSPGGPNDLVARVLASKLTETLGQPIIVDNKPGAGMILANGSLAKATPDGLTLGIIATPFVTNPFLVASLPYDSTKDFSPVASVAILPMVLVVNAASPYKTLKELISAARKHPGQLKFSSPAVGGAPHLAGEMLKKDAGIDALHVPYKGIPEARLALLRGEVDFLFDSLESMELIRTGKLRSLGIATRERLPALKDMPTLSETIPGFTVEAFTGIAAPAGTPPEIVQRLNTAINEAVLSPEVDGRFKQMMFVPDTMSVNQFKAFLDQQASKWGTLVKSLNLNAK